MKKMYQVTKICQINCLALVMLLVASGSISAQEQTSAQDEGEGRLLEEVTVTASKREASSHDLPVSITAMTSEDLQKIGAVGYAEYLNTVPGVSFPDQGAGRSAIIMRGVSTSTNTSNLQSAVAILIDDLPQLNRWSSWTRLDLNMFDIERVEVLRGPQGTLFGSGSMGGIVRIITNKPDSTQSELAVELDYSMIHGGDNSTGINAMMNVPLIEDELALRIVGFQRDNGGWIDDIRKERETGDNRTSGSHAKNINDGTSVGGRVKLGWTPSERFEAGFAINYQKDTLDHTNWSFKDTTFGGPYEASPVLYQYSETESTQYNLTLTYDFDAFALDSNTAYGVRDSLMGQDGAASFDRYPACQGGTVPVTLGCAGFNMDSSDMSINHQTDSFSQDLRLTSRGDGKLEWVTGFYYLDQEGYTPQVWYNPDAAIPGGQANPPDYHTAAEEAGYLLDALYIVGVKEVALYGEATFAFNDQWSVTAGLRWYDSSFDFEVPLFDGIAARAFGTLRVPPSSNSESGFLPKIAITYALSESVNFYASRAEGYRLGQINFGAGGVDPISGESIPLGFKTDKLVSYEIGMKAFFLNNKMQANVALFMQDWNDIQLSRNTVSNLNYTDNAGDATSNGIELELVALPANAWETGLTATYTDATLDSVLPGVNIVPGITLPGTPKFSGNLYAEWTLDNVFNNRNGYMRVDYKYTTEMEGDLANNPDLRSDAYGVGTFRAGLYLTDDFEAVLYVNNFLNEDAVTVVQNGLALHNTGPLAYRQKPRTIGLTFRGRFAF